MEGVSIKLRKQDTRKEVPEVFIECISECDEDREYYKSLMTENPMAKEEEPEVHKNQFHSTERGTQTKIFKFSDEALQTDPLPV